MDGHCSFIMSAYSDCSTWSDFFNDNETINAGQTGTAGQPPDRNRSNADAARCCIPIQDNYRKLSKEHAELGPVVALYNDYVQVQADVDAAQEMLADPEMKEFARKRFQLRKGR